VYNFGSGPLSLPPLISRILVSTLLPAFVDTRIRLIESISAAVTTDSAGAPECSSVLPGAREQSSRSDLDSRKGDHGAIVWSISFWPPVSYLASPPAARALTYIIATWRPRIGTLL
jgi:hypothetical protein